MAGSINLANVALGFDASKVTRGVDLTAGEMRKLNGIFQGSISQVDRYNAEMQILDKSRKTGAMTADRLVQAEESLAKKYGLLTQAIEKTNIAKKHQLDLDRQRAWSQSSGGGGSGFGSELLSGLGMGKFIGGGPIAGIAAIAVGSAVLKQSVDLASSAQSAAISFEVLTGSATKANSLISGMRKLDAESPLSFLSLQQGAKTMLGFGVVAERIIPTLRQLGDISMGDADKFQSLSLAFGQTTAAGRLMGQEVLQMINAGFNPLQQISKDTGISMVDLKKKMEQGAISTQMVADAYKNATVQGGMFHGMTERISNETYQGAQAKLSNEISKGKTMLGDMSLPYAQSAMNFLSQNLAFVNHALQMSIDILSNPKSGQVHGPNEKYSQYSQAIPKNLAKATDEMKKQEEMQGRLLNTERSSFLSQVNHIKEQYDRKMMGEEKFHEFKLRNSMKYEHMTKKEKQMLDQSIGMMNELSRMDKFAKDEHYRQFRDDQLRDRQEKKNKIQEDLKEKQGKARSDGMDGLGISQTIAPALKAGSVEAYKFMLNQKDKLFDVAQDQQRTMAEALEIAKKQLAAAENQPLLNKKR